MGGPLGAAPLFLPAVVVSTRTFNWEWPMSCFLTLPMTVLLVSLATTDGERVPAGQPVQPDSFIRVTGEAVDIRTAPSTSSTAIGQSRAGDVFEYRGREGDWYTINMFSGEWRYIHTSQAERTIDLPPLPTSEAKRKEAFRALLRAEDRAQAHARARYPVSPGDRSSLDRHVEHSRIWNDRLKLEPCHEHGIQPAHFNSLKLEGIKKNWDL